MKYDKFSRLFWRAVDDARTSIMCVKICAIHVLIFFLPTSALPPVISNRSLYRLLFGNVTPTESLSVSICYRLAAPHTYTNQHQQLPVSLNSLTASFEKFTGSAPRADGKEGYRTGQGLRTSQAYFFCLSLCPWHEGKVRRLAKKGSIRLTLCYQLVQRDNAGMRVRLDG